MRGKRDNQVVRDSAHLIDTPKHLIAIAASKKTAAAGNVIFDTAKNEERRWGVRVAQRLNIQRPSAPMHPEVIQVSAPGSIPPEAIT